VAVFDDAVCHVEAIKGLLGERDLFLKRAFGRVLVRHFGDQRDLRTDAGGIA